MNPKGKNERHQYDFHFQENSWPGVFVEPRRGFSDSAEGSTSKEHEEQQGMLLIMQKEGSEVWIFFFYIK